MAFCSIARREEEQKHLQKQLCFSLRLGQVLVLIIAPHCSGSSPAENWTIIGTSLVAITTISENLPNLIF